MGFIFLFEYTVFPSVDILVACRKTTRSLVLAPCVLWGCGRTTPPHPRQPNTPAPMSLSLLICNAHHSLGNHTACLDGLRSSVPSSRPVQFTCVISSLINTLRLSKLWWSPHFLMLPSCFERCHKSSQDQIISAAFILQLVTLALTWGLLKKKERLFTPSLST